MKTIEVIPNPYAAIDADGVPQGVVGLPGARHAWIGAALDAVASAQTKKSRFYFPAGNERRKDKSVAGMRVVTLEVSDANIRATVANAVLEGSLIVVTAEDAAKLGISEFLAPDKALEREQKRATAKFRALKNDKSVELGKIPHEATPDPNAGEEAEAGKAAPAAPNGPTVRVTANVRLNPSPTEA